MHGGKELFTMNNNSFVTLAPGITSDDNIVYTITSEDRESLRNENKDFQFDNKRLKSSFIPCNTSGYVLYCR